MIEQILIYFLGAISGFMLCCLFTFIKIKNRDETIETLKNKIDNYKILDDDITMDLIMESIEDERTNRED